MAKNHKSINKKDKETAWEESEMTYSKKATKKEKSYSLKNVKIGLIKWGEKDRIDTLYCSNEVRTYR